MGPDSSELSRSWWRIESSQSHGFQQRGAFTILRDELRVQEGDDSEQVSAERVTFPSHLEVRADRI
jgi:hypothetical protein